MYYDKLKHLSDMGYKESEITYNNKKDILELIGEHAGNTVVIHGKLNIVSEIVYEDYKGNLDYAQQFMDRIFTIIKDYGLKELGEPKDMIEFAVMRLNGMEAALAILNIDIDEIKDRRKVYVNTETVPTEFLQSKISYFSSANNTNFKTEVKINGTGSFFNSQTLTLELPLIVDSTEKGDYEIKDLAFHIAHMINTFNDSQPRNNRKKYTIGDILQNPDLLDGSNCVRSSKSADGEIIFDIA